MQDKKKLAEAERAAKEAQEVAELRKTMVFKVWVGQLGMAACGMILMHESGRCSTKPEAYSLRPLLPTVRSWRTSQLQLKLELGVQASKAPQQRVRAKKKGPVARPRLTLPKSPCLATRARKSARR